MALAAAVAVRPTREQRAALARQGKVIQEATAAMFLLALMPVAALSAVVVVGRDRLGRRGQSSERLALAATAATALRGPLTGTPMLEEEAAIRRAVVAVAQGLLGKEEQVAEETLAQMELPIPAVVVVVAQMEGLAL